MRVPSLAIVCALFLAAVSAPEPSLARPDAPAESLPALPPAPAPLSPALQDQAVSRARALLDSWEGDKKVLHDAARLLIRVIQANPKHVNAHLQMARFYFKDGYLYAVKFKPEALDRAANEIDRALKADPKSADAYVLLGYYHYVVGQPETAFADLKKAEAIGTKNPWLYLNWADALMSLDRWAEAKEKLEVLRARYEKDPNVPRDDVLALYEKLKNVDIFSGSFQGADKLFRQILALDPSSAWNHGNYASFLLFYLDDPDGAIREAQTALDIRDYGMARETLSAAYYAKWAQLRHTDPDKAAEYFSLARSWSNFSFIMPQAAKSVDAGPVMQATVKELKDVGVSIDTPDEDNNTGLTLAAHYHRSKSVALLLAYGASTEARNNYGQTALAIAADEGYVDVAETLLAHGADVNTRDNSGWTPLFLAVGRQRDDMVRLLLSHKADPNLVSHVGLTPLMAAALQGDDKLARMLLAAGANPGLATLEKKETAADLADEAGHRDLASFLRQYGKK